MNESLREIVEGYDPELALQDASAPPAAWYTDPAVFELERKTVFRRSWQLAGRAEQVRDPGQFVTADLAGEPIALVRGEDGTLRGFFNVCRHKGAAVLTATEGRVRSIRCPYHGWSYALDGRLVAAPEFGGVRGFERESQDLVPAEAEVWERWAFVRLEPGGPGLRQFLGPELERRFAGLRLDRLRWTERRGYPISCNWKVFVDNYLDGGYHVPRLHRGLNSVLDYSRYRIENGGRFCIQSSPLTGEHPEDETAAVRTGQQAIYIWIYPNLMVNCYEGVMDVNWVRPLAADRTEVIFDFYFADPEPAPGYREASIAVSERIQEEDVAICESVQRGLRSRSYSPGRLSADREAGEQLFHRLLYHDLRSGLGPPVGKK